MPMIVCQLHQDKNALTLKLGQDAVSLLQQIKKKENLANNFPSLCPLRANVTATKTWELDHINIVLTSSTDAG